MTTDHQYSDEHSETELTSPSSTEPPREPETSNQNERASEPTRPETSPSTPVVRLAASAFELAREAEAGLGTPTGIGAVYALAAALGEVVAAVSASDEEAEENFKRALSTSLHRRNLVMAQKAQLQSS